MKIVNFNGAAATPVTVSFADSAKVSDAKLITLYGAGRVQYQHPGKCHKHLDRDNGDVGWKGV